MVIHILGIYDFLSLCNLSVWDPGSFSKLVGEFVLDLVVGCPFVNICEFGLGQS